MADIRRMNAATAAVTLACLFTKWLCYVLGRLHSMCLVLESTAQNRTYYFCYKTLVNDDFSKLFLNFLFIYVESHKF